MGIRLLKRIFCCVCAAMLLLLFIPAETAFAEDKYPIVYGDVPDGGEICATLITEEEDYTVEPGESLWKIAEKLWGDGNGYVELADDNKDLISDPDMIYPGMTLKVLRRGNIITKESRAAYMQAGEYLVNTPYGWTVGISQSGDAWANFTWSGDSDGVIACLIRDKEKETSKTVQDFEECIRKITAYAEKNYPKQVSELEFEHYRTENQDGALGEMYLYSYDWHISPEYPDLICKICVGLKLTDHIQAEFVGYAFNDDIQSSVRYVTATFEELYDPESGEEFTVNNSNMDIQPQVEWEIPGMFNSFAYVDEFFGSLLEAVTGSTEDDSSADKWTNGYRIEGR